MLVVPMNAVLKQICFTKGFTREKSTFTDELCDREETRRGGHGPPTENVASAIRREHYH